MAPPVTNRFYRARYGNALGQQLISACGGVAGEDWQKCLGGYMETNLISDDRAKYVARTELFTDLLKAKMPHKLIHGAVNKDDYNALRDFLSGKTRKTVPGGAADGPNAKPIAKPNVDGEPDLSGVQERMAGTPPQGFPERKRKRACRRSSGSGRRSSGALSTGPMDAAEALEHAKLTAALAEAKNKINMLEKAGLGDADQMSKIIAENNELKQEQALVIGQQQAFVDLQNELQKSLDEQERLMANGVQASELFASEVAEMNKTLQGKEKLIDSLQEQAAAMNKTLQGNEMLIDSLQEQALALQEKALGETNMKRNVLGVLVQITRDVLNPEKTCADRQEIVVTQLKLLRADPMAESCFRACAARDTFFGNVIGRVLK